MKKLKLKALELDAKEVLTREQLRKIIGGAGSGSGNGPWKCCWTDYPNDCSACNAGGYCDPGAILVYCNM